MKHILIELDFICYSYQHTFSDGSMIKYSTKNRKSKHTMSSLRFQVYLPSRYGPERVLNSSIDLTVTSSDAFLTLSSMTCHNQETVQSRRKRPAAMISQDDPTLNQAFLMQTSYMHQRMSVSIEQDPAFLRVLNRYAHIYNRSFPRTPCGYCAILLLDRQIVWTVKQEHVDYGLF